MKKEHQILFTPIKIGSVEIKNRYVMSPMADFGLVDAQGIPTDAGVEYFVTRARGGIGLILTGVCYVDDEVEQIVEKTLMCTPKTDKWLALQQYNKMAERIHAFGGKLFVQLGSGYGRSGHYPEGVRRAVGPSEMTNRWDPNLKHEAMTTAEVETIVRKFGEAAEFFKKAGVDGVEIHAVHEGYLLDQFCTEFFNHRTDKYGGSFENRYRFAVEIVETIKERCGKNFPVSVRFTPKHMMKGLLDGAVAGEDFVEVGRDMPEGIEAAKLLEKAGYDALNIDLGCYDAHFWNHPSVYQKDGLYLDAAAQVKEAVSIPILVAGRMDDPDMGSSAITAGKCDMVALGRPCLADPEIPNKVATEKFAQIRPCIACNYGCSAKVHASAGRQGCAVNAQAAYELDTVLHPALEKKKIVVIGGGPAGCECARVAALRGHEVVLLEREARLGGALHMASQPPFKYHDKFLIAYFENELKRLGVAVNTYTAATIENVQAENPDVVVTACGASSFVPPIAGNEFAILPKDILFDIEFAGDNVVVIGAGQVGAEIGLWLSQLGRKVTIVEATESFMPQAHYSDAEHAMALLKYNGSEVLLGVTVNEITQNSVSVTDAQGNPQVLKADTTVMATGFRGDTKVYETMREALPIVYNIGDSVKARNIFHAVHEAYELASHL